jgi:hypothetical protein
MEVLFANLSLNLAVPLAAMLGSQRRTTTEYRLADANLYRKAHLPDFSNP